MDTWDSGRAAQWAAPETMVIHHSPEDNGVPELSLAVAVDLFSAVMVTWVCALCWRSCWMSFSDSDRPVPSYLKSRRQKSLKQVTKQQSWAMGKLQHRARLHPELRAFWGLGGSQPSVRIAGFQCSRPHRTGQPTLPLSQSHHTGRKMSFFPLS